MESNDSLLSVKSRRGCRIKSYQVFIVAATILLSIFITLLSVGFLVNYEVESDVSDSEIVSYWKEDLPTEQRYWYNKGIDELQHALSINLYKKRAKNVIVFVVHGVGPEVLARARFSSGEGQEVKSLVWDTFPHMGRLMNSCSNSDICDAFTIGTALFGGVKTEFRIGGLDSSVAFRNCSATVDPRHHVKSILSLAQDVGLRTGFVTTKRVTGPTIAALYAHTPDTSWECDSAMPKGELTRGCQDVAEQLALGETGQRMNVIMGGGRQGLVTNVPTPEWDPLDPKACDSQAYKRNLLRDWRKMKLTRNESFEVLHNWADLQRLNGSSIDHILGIFANGDLRVMRKPNSEEDLCPGLGDMVEKSLEILRRRDQRFMLVVETAVQGNAGPSDVLEINEVIAKALEISSPETDDTLALVLFTNGDHASTGKDTSAETEFLTNFWDIADDDQLLDDRLKKFVSDSVLYAKGPRSYLLHGLHSETFMAHMIAYALQMAEFEKNL